MLRPRWAGIVLLALVTAVSGCGGDGDSGGSADESQTPTASPETSYDGDWSGTLSTGGVIEVTVSGDAITSVKITSDDEVFGPACGVLDGANEIPDTDFAIEDGTFSWGGPGEGYPVEGQFDSETTASGTAEFAAPEVMDEPAPGCTSASATWEATTGDSAAASTPPEESAGAAVVSDASAACVVDLGYEIAEEGATDLPIADADGEGLPVVDGAAGIGIRGKGGAGVFYVYETSQQANAAYTGSASNPDIELVAPRVDAIAIDNVLVMSDGDFAGDDIFYLAECFGCRRSGGGWGSSAKMPTWSGRGTGWPRQGSRAS